MSIFLLYGDNEYSEGEDLLGLYSSKEKAELERDRYHEKAKKYQKKIRNPSLKDRKMKDVQYYSFYYIREFTIDAPATLIF